jgi:hypothetical protein
MKIRARLTEETAKYYQGLSLEQKAQTLTTVIDLGRYSARQIAIVPLQNIGLPENQKKEANGLTKTQSEAFRKSMSGLIAKEDGKFDTSLEVEIEDDLFYSLDESLKTLGIHDTNVNEYFITYLYYTLMIQSAFAKVFKTNELVELIEVSNKYSNILLPLIRYIFVPITKAAMKFKNFIQRIKSLTT